MPSSDDVTLPLGDSAQRAGEGDAIRTPAVLPPLASLEPSEGRVTSLSPWESRLARAGEGDATGDGDANQADAIDRIIQMAWEDRTTFDAIRTQFGLTPGEVIQLMRRELKPSSFKLWRARTSGRATKHLAKRSFKVGRFRCPDQKNS